MPARLEQIPDGQVSRADKLWERVGQESPYCVSATLCLTEKCNLSCPHCFVPTCSEESALALPEVIKVLDDLAEMNVLKLGITGGEPALRDDLEQIIDAAIERRFFVRLKTNGVLLTANRVAALFELGLKHIDFSVYSDRPAEHDEFVGEISAWEKTLQAATKFRSLGGTVCLSTMVFNWNWERVRHIIDHCENNGFGYAVSPQISCRNDGQQGPTLLRTSESQMQKLFADPRLMNKQELLKLRARLEDRSLCRAGDDAILIQPNGDVKLCQSLPWIIGNTKTKKISKIWEESDIRAWFIDLRWRDLPQCSTCEISWACNRCPASALLETGDVLGISPGDCQIARAKIAVCQGSGSI